MSDLVVHLARFAGELRSVGVRTSIGDEIDALEALSRLDLGDPAEVKAGLRCALKVRKEDEAAFEELFARFWLQAAAARPSPPSIDRDLAANTRRAGQAPGRSRAQELDGEARDGEQPGYSPDEVLRHKPFDECDDSDLARMERLLARLARQLATRKSRRFVPVRGRGAIDLRRSLRKAPATFGELLSLARRARPVELPRLVVLCDTSASMRAHARFLLAFAYALRRVARRTEVFAFNTGLTRITSWLREGSLDAALERMTAAVPGWSGGTRIGESLEAFVARHLDELVDARAVVIILSDGLDLGEPERVAGAMRAIRRRARRVFWLNPLLGDPRYQPTARGMAAALPFVDRLAPAHDLESLERLLPQLSV